ncbi:MAG: hypothetical protein WC209_12750 [Ignavibacteriaceae bacterium]|jgi:predicted GH43/DUF377 family glycosyl hydrolase
MKNILVLVVLVLFVGCKKDTTLVSSQTENKGQVLLKIDKTQKPNNVISVIAYLSRNNFDTLKNVLNFVSDSSADISFNSIEVGIWHLRIDALNENSKVIYSGETDVTVVEGITTQVNLTLLPASSGYGSLYILVNWGTNNSKWIDYNLNPVLIKTNSLFDVGGIIQPKVIFDENSYKMWYANVGNNGVHSVGYAVSTDGLHWYRKVDKPVLTAGSNGSWDSYGVSVGAVIKDNGTYKMYFIGNPSHAGPYQIGLAVSNDGINWTKYPNPVLHADSIFEFSSIASEVLKINNKYYMYYSVSTAASKRVVCLAFSDDGVNWIRYNNNPILSVTEPWEGVGAYYPTVILDKNKYVMVFENYFESATAFGMAYSSDGINWTKDSNNPIFTKNTTYNHATNYIQNPYLIKIDNEYRLYYVGFNLSTNEANINLVRKFN